MCTTIGRPIDMDIGPGVRLMVGRGSAPSRGDGRLITMAAGSITIIVGLGVLAAVITAIVVGGDPPSLHFISHLETTTVGIR